jgi:malate/lactate dehydrogenase
VQKIVELQLEEDERAAFQRSVAAVKALIAEMQRLLGN